MGKIPVAPRYAKMILLAHKKNCMQYVIAAVAALTVKVRTHSFDPSLNQFVFSQRGMGSVRKIIFTYIDYFIDFLCRNYLQTM